MSPVRAAQGVSPAGRAQVLAAGSSNSSAAAGRRLLDGGDPSANPSPPLNAASAPALAAAFKAANSAAANYPDPGVRAGLWANTGEWLLYAASAATANVNQAAAAAGSAVDVEKTSYIAQTKARTAAGNSAPLGSRQYWPRAAQTAWRRLSHGTGGEGFAQQQGSHMRNAGLCGSCVVCMAQGPEAASDRPCTTLSPMQDVALADHAARSVMCCLRAQLADALLALRRGDMTLDQFKSATSPDAVQRWMAATQLPGTLGARCTCTPDSLHSI